MAVWKRIKRTALYLFLTALGVFFCTPVLFLLAGSVTSRYELGQYLVPLSDAAKGFVYWKWMPDYPAFSHYENVLLFTPQFYVVFWNSVKITAFILAGQLLVAVPAAWAFAIYPFPRRRLLFTVYLALMLMPFQVTMLSSYLVLNGLHLMNTHGAVILPAVFSAFPVFLIYRSFCGIPKELLEAARVDGAGEWQIFWRMGIPLASGGILSSAVLGFLECWNLIEQPLAFLKDQSLWPLSLYLPEISLDQAGYAFVASVITLIPALFVFLLGRDYLERGIAASALKE